MTLVPNQRCTCGFTRFRENRASVTTAVNRWMLFDASYPPGGLGATPFGTYFGGGGPGTSWGLFSGSVRAAQLDVVCESCSRTRVQKRLGGIAVFGGYISDGYFYIVASDVQIPVTCYSLRVSGPNETYEVPLSYVPGSPLAVLAPSPPVTALFPPPGAPTVNVMLRAPLPEVSETASYTITVVDRCCGCDTPVATVTLEAPAMLLSALDADISGAPRQWLSGSRLALDPGQPPGCGRTSIPFDKCSVVIEYDARDGVLPDAQGWVRNGLGSPTDWSLSPGGALRLDAISPSDNYYEKTITPGVVPTQIYMYGSTLSEDIPAGSPGSGLEFQAIYAPSASPYRGVRLNFRENQTFYTELSGGNDNNVFGIEAPPGWLSSGAATQTGGKDLIYENGSLSDVAFIAPLFTFGTVGSAPGDEVTARFGNVDGTLSFVAHIRNFVAADGRFIRARFTSYAPVSSPRLRLYVVSDANGSAAKTARFKVNYGSATGAPGGPLPLSISATVNMVTANTVYEIPLTLTGLAANTPVCLSVERDWAHVDDQLQATVHLLQATIRSS